MIQCMRQIDGVRCSKMGKYYPVLNLVPLHDPDGALRAELPVHIPLCTEHRREVTVQMVLTDDAWLALCKAFKSSGKDVPSRNDVQLTFCSIETVHKFERMKQCSRGKSGFSLTALMRKTRRVFTGE